MKKSILQLAATTLILSTTVSLKAQVVVTELMAMNDSFRLDLKDKKVQKALYAKGVLELDWNDVNHTLSISYNPKQIRSAEVLLVLKEVSETPLPIAKNDVKAVPITPF